MKKILISIFVALSIGAVVALRMYSEGEHDIGFIVAMALAMVAAIAIAAPKRFTALIGEKKSKEVESPNKDRSDFLNGWSKPIRNVAAVVFLVATPMLMYLQGERNIEIIALMSLLTAFFPFGIHFKIQQTKWHFENDESLYKSQPDLVEKFSIPLETKQANDSVKEAFNNQRQPTR